MGSRVKNSEKENNEEFHEEIFGENRNSVCV